MKAFRSWSDGSTGDCGALKERSGWVWMPNSSERILLGAKAGALPITTNQSAAARDIDYSRLIPHMATADIKQTLSSLQSPTVGVLSACAVCELRLCCSADYISLCIPSYLNKGLAARQPSHITSHQKGWMRKRRRRESGGRNGAVSIT